MRPPEEEEDLNKAARWLIKNGFCIERFSTSEMKASKTPDFRLYRSGKHVAFCEVKSPRDQWLDERLANSVPFQIVGGIRHDPTFNRISGHITKAARQFDAVNKDRAVPNILVFVNWAATSTFRDLSETLSGYFESKEGGRIATMLNVSNGRMIGTRKHRIDMYVWFDGQHEHPQGYFFSRANPNFVSALCDWFELDTRHIHE